MTRSEDRDHHAPRCSFTTSGGQSRRSMEPGQIFPGKAPSGLWASQAEAQDTGWYHAHTEPLLPSPDRVFGGCYSSASKVPAFPRHWQLLLGDGPILFLPALPPSACSFQLWILSVVAVSASLPLHLLVESLLRGGTDPPLGLSFLLWSGSPGLYL